jgi:outer membrane biosynthesis protein TonB
MRKSFLLSAVCAFALLACVAQAQNAAEKFPFPAEPEPAPQTKPLIVPKGTMQPNPHTAEVKVFDPPCLSPEEPGGYGFSGTIAQQEHGVIDEYIWNMRKHIYDHWLTPWPRMAGRPWWKKGITGVKFTIEKNGMVDMPFVTLTSGRADFDEHAVASLQEMSPLPPPPAGTKLLRMCMFFYYNLPNPELARPRTKPDYGGWLNKPAATSH